jgi:uncharacterized protein YbaR (Trm112 family)
MANGLRIDETMLPLIRCPASYQKLRLATADELARVNDSIAQQRLTTVGGDQVQEPLEAALIREDGTLLYPVVDGIARLIVDDGIKLPSDLTLPAPAEGGNGEPQ